MRFFIVALFILGGFFWNPSFVMANGDGHHRKQEEVPTHHDEVEGHDHSAHAAEITTDYGKLISWLGNFHPLSLHFPIALILMTGVAELLFAISRSTIYDHAAKFMIIAAAVMAIPTVLFGLAYAYGATYEYPLSEIFWWHRLLGLSVAGLAILTAILKFYLTGVYHLCLSVLVILVTVTGYLGGEMTFGLNHFFQ